jgi:hypothetical protein
MLCDPAQAEILDMNKVLYGAPAVAPQCLNLFLARCMN